MTDTVRVLAAKLRMRSLARLSLKKPSRTDKEDAKLDIEAADALERQAAMLAASPQGKGPGGWLVKDFADGWYWTGDRLSADMAANGGACVFNVDTGTYETGSRPQGEGSSASADAHRAAEGAVVAEKVKLILSTYLALINRTPDLLSLLYDADMLPEQTVTVRGAISVAAVCEAYQAGQQAAVSTAERVGMSEANAPYRPTEGVKP